MQLAVDHASDKDGAGTAIAFGASFFCAHQPALQPEEIEKRLGRPDISQRNIFAIQDEADAVVHDVPVVVLFTNGYAAVQPPSIEICVPVTWRASSLAR
jgi:hypothetical protein